MTKLPKGFKNMPVTNKNLIALQRAWQIPADEFEIDSATWRNLIKTEFVPKVNKPVMKHVMQWIETPL